MTSRTISLVSVAAAGAVLLTAMQLSARVPADESLPNEIPQVKAASRATVPAPFTFLVARDGNTARYRVTEQLVGLDLPNDAVGETNAVSGSIGLDKSGNVIPEASRIVVNVTNLKSDKDRRDGYIKRRTLETDKFPEIELVVTRIHGVKLPVPKSGKRSFTLDGNLTVRGVMRPTTWSVSAAFSDSVVTGRAYTKFAFASFGLDKPRVQVVLSVADTIALEYDFKLVRTKASK